MKLDWRSVSLEGAFSTVASDKELFRRSHHPRSLNERMESNASQI